MSNVYFVQTRHHYATYDDFFKLATLAGYPIIYLDEVDPQSNNVYIVTPLNGEWLAGWQNPKACIILWELEWRTDWRADVNTPPGIAQVWASDPAYAKAIGARFVPLGSDERLDISTVDRTPVYDVVQLSYQTYRRQQVTVGLREYGLQLAPGSAWGVGRSDILRQSRLMVHTHQNDGTPYAAPLRFALAAAHQTPLLSETLTDRSFFGYTYLMVSSQPYLAQFANLLLRDTHPMLYDYALALHDLLCIRHPFRDCVERSV